MGPLKANDAELLAMYATFFSSPDLDVLLQPCAIEPHGFGCMRFKPLDSLHLAAAVEHGCTRFLSNAAQLKRFPDILVEILS